MNNQESIELGDALLKSGIDIHTATKVRKYINIILGDDKWTKCSIAHAKARIEHLAERATRPCEVKK